MILTSNSVRSPPSVPPRNGSKLEHAEQISQQRKYFDSNIEPLTCSPDLGKSDAKAVTVDQEKSNDVTDKSYRDSWKSRSDQQNNSFVFNFVNSKKDVSHIENDGLDLTKRSKKVGVGVLYICPNKNQHQYRTVVTKCLNLNQDNVLITLSSWRPRPYDKVHIFVILSLMILNKTPCIGQQTGRES